MGTCLRDEVLSSEPDLLSRLGCTVIVDEMVGPRTAGIEVSDGSIRVVFQDDQGIFGVGVGPAGDGYWASVGILALFMGKKSPEDPRGVARFGRDFDLPRTVVLRGGIDFILEHWETLRALFGPPQWRSTREEISEFIQMRASMRE